MVLEQFRSLGKNSNLVNNQLQVDNRNDEATIISNQLHHNPITSPPDKH